MAFQLLEGEVGEVTHDDRETFSVHTEVTIAAPPDRVWAVLTDFDRLPEWSPSFIAFEGEFRKDGPAKVTYKVGIGNLKQVFEHPLIYFEAGRMFGWSAPLPHMHMHDNHKFTVESRPDGETQFIQTDQFVGHGAHWIGGTLARQTMQNYVEFNRALKERVEGMAD